MGEKRYKQNDDTQAGGICGIMKKVYILWSIVSAMIMLMLPWLAVTFVKGDAGMAACLILFFGVDPIYSIITGAFVGKDLRYL